MITLSIKLKSTPSIFPSLSPGSASADMIESALDLPLSSLYELYGYAL